MKRFTLLAIALLSITFVQAQQSKQKLVPKPEPGDLISFSQNALDIINNKCLSCHSPSGDDEDAKDALIWEDIQHYSKKLALLTLDDILVSLEEGEMPPKETIQKSPEAALTANEKSALLEWVETSLAKLE